MIESSHVSLKLPEQFVQNKNPEQYCKVNIDVFICHLKPFETFQFTFMHIFLVDHHTSILIIHWTDLEFKLQWLSFTFP